MKIKDELDFIIVTTALHHFNDSLMIALGQVEIGEKYDSPMKDALEMLKPFFTVTHKETGLTEDINKVTKDFICHIGCALTDAGMHLNKEGYKHYFNRKATDSPLEKTFFNLVTQGEPE